MCYVFHKRYILNELSIALWDFRSVSYQKWETFIDLYKPSFPMTVRCHNNRFLILSLSLQTSISPDMITCLSTRSSCMDNICLCSLCIISYSIVCYTSLFIFTHNGFEIEGTSENNKGRRAHSNRWTTLHNCYFIYRPRKHER